MQFSDDPNLEARRKALKERQAEVLARLNRLASARKELSSGHLELLQSAAENADRETLAALTGALELVRVIDELLPGVEDEFNALAHELNETLKLKLQKQQSERS